MEGRKIGVRGVVLTSGAQSTHGVVWGVGGGEVGEGGGGGGGRGGGWGRGGGGGVRGEAEEGCNEGKNMEAITRCRLPLCHGQMSFKVNVLRWAVAANSRGARRMYLEALWARRRHILVNARVTAACLLLGVGVRAA